MYVNKGIFLQRLLQNEGSIVNFKKNKMPLYKTTKKEVVNDLFKT